MKKASKTSTRTKTAAPASRAARPAPASRAARPAPALRAARSAPVTRTARAAASQPPAPTKREVAVQAYELYAKSGYQPGREVEFWLEAERQLQRKTLK